MSYDIRPHMVLPGAYTMTIRYAVVTEQGQTFTVVLVQKAFLDNRPTADQAIQWLQTRHFHMPTALLARDERGALSGYYGRSDLAVLLARVPLSTMTWQESVVAR